MTIKCLSPIAVAACLVTSPLVAWSADTSSAETSPTETSPADARSADARSAGRSSFDGHAHWYGGQFHGRRTASGAVFDKMKLTAAHPSLPFGTKVLVHSKHTGKEVVVTVTDRCPPLKQRCIDLSEGAARQLGIYPTAPSNVHCQVVDSHHSVAVQTKQGQ
jgi:rare lipoprotein A